MTEKTFSIIISTFNRSGDLRTALESFFRQSGLDRIKFELLVIDNNSTDDTRTTVEEYIREYGERVQYLFEPRQGKSYALNTAIKSARGRVIIFSDDDVTFDQHWLAAYDDALKIHSFDAACGRIKAVLTETTPAWIRDNLDILCGPIVNYDYGDEVTAYDPKGMPPFVGANMAIRKDILEKIGLFNTDLGPGRGTFGDDTELFNRILKTDPKLFYVGQALVWHPIPEGRVNLNYVARWKMAAGRYYALEQKEEMKQGVALFCGFPRYLLRKTAEGIMETVISVFDRRKLLKGMSKLFISVGMISEFRKQNLGVKV